MNFSAILARSLLSALPVTAMLQCAATPVLAGLTTFDPYVATGRSYTDNVEYTGDGAAARSDWSTHVGVMLPVQRKMERGSVDLTYRGSYRQYDDSERLDDTWHRLRFAATRQTSQLSSLGFSASYVRTQDQADLVRLQEEEEQDPNPFVSVRTEEETYAVGLRYGRRANERWRWSSSVSAGRSRFETVDAAAPAQLGVEDRTTYRGSLGINRTMSERTSLRSRYRFTTNDLDLSGNEDVHQLGVTVNHSFNPRFGIGLRLGGYRRTADAAGSSGDENGFEAGLDFKFNDGLLLGPVRFRFGAGVTPSSGGSLIGTALKTQVFVSASNAVDRSWSWRAATVYARREPYEDQVLETLDTLTVAASVERALSRKLGIRLAGRYVDQSGDSVASNASFYRLSAGVAWHPLRQTGIANR